jgi:hypothetical protein
VVHRRLAEAYEAAGERADAVTALGVAAEILDELGHPDADEVRARIAAVQRPVPAS